jgi:hypothetical protein
MGNGRDVGIRFAAALARVVAGEHGVHVAAPGAPVVAPPAGWHADRRGSVHAAGSVAGEAWMRVGRVAGAWTMILLSLAVVVGLPLAQWLRNRA